MKYCKKHTCWFSIECSKCVDNEGPYLRERGEVADDETWNEYVKLGWDG